ncbi:MAG: sugar transferase [Myxococcales bacterium]|nr:sugar transferase [Myxococcales bacterium]
MKQAGWRACVKQVVDRAAAAAGLTLAAPLMLGVAAAVRVDLGSPVLFTQARPGKNGEVFRVFKFRTMRDLNDADGRPLPDAMRLTPLGRWLRATSLDELPQLLNVLAGELSLVGPRPLLVRYLDRYSPHQARRHEVMPGITGWAQINGRNALSWDEKFDLDVWYVDHWSLALDAKILLKTVGKVLRRDGISNQNAATMPEFMGAAAGGPT